MRCRRGLRATTPTRAAEIRRPSIAGKRLERAWRGGSSQCPLSFRGPACPRGCSSALASPAFSSPPRRRTVWAHHPRLVATDQACHRPACREWGLRPQAPPPHDDELGRCAEMCTSVRARRAPRARGRRAHSRYVELAPAWSVLTRHRRRTVAAGPRAWAAERGPGATATLNARTPALPTAKNGRTAPDPRTAAKRMANAATATATAPNCQTLQRNPKQAFSHDPARPRRATVAT